MEREGRSRRPAARGGWFRRAVESSLLLLVAVLIGRTWFVEGLFLPLGIPSGSMAQTLRGPHCRFVCPNCQSSFLCDAAVPLVGAWRVCPYCGHMTENVPPLKVLSGDRVILLRPAFCWRPPRRWEVVAFRDPNRPSQLAVKRIVGLPGESVQLRHGDVYIDGKIQRKELDRQREMAVLVHDASTVTGGQGKADLRWYPAGAHSRWVRSEDGFRHLHAGEADAEGPSRDRLPKKGVAGHEPNEDATDDRSEQAVDWLVYHHQRRVGEHLRASPVTDELSYNQWRTQRNDETRFVADLMLCFRVGDILGNGRLVVRATQGKHRLETWINPKTGACEVRLDGPLVWHEQVPVSLPIGKEEMTFSVIDRQLMLVLGRRVVICRPLSPADWSGRPSECPLAIGAVGLELNLSNLRVYRDVYYARPPGFAARWGFERPVELGPREYFVLGDNSLISEDSRSWPAGAALSSKWLIGKPLVVSRP
ncbi:MAG: hypothetical protein JW888_08575 [Pirellulales bacterium]|nr:hypothetical protein [Pirellulales bacterium]